jgi:FtsP/CotA-like multicopper oxidase with cupredoxin domain
MWCVSPASSPRIGTRAVPWLGFFSVGSFVIAILAAVCPGTADGANVPLPTESCPRPGTGQAVPEPRDLRSEHGTLRVDLSIRDQKEPDGSIRFCYLLADGSQSPTLRLHPGDQLILELKNDLTDPLADGAPRAHHHRSSASTDPCTSGIMSLMSTNLHFHGLTVPPVCHQDEVLRTSVQPGQAPFEYRYKIPDDEPPGLYWYHPHIHGFSKVQVLGGASGAIVIEGLERAQPVVAGLPERVFVIRDQDLSNPEAPPAKSEPVVPKMFIDRDGDSANNGTGFGKPAKDLSINFVPVPYPDYPPALIAMKPGQRQLWRVVNASAITYLNLALLFNRAPQKLGIVAIDGVPLGIGPRMGTAAASSRGTGNASGTAADAVQWPDHIGIPPGGRAEFMVNAPPLGVSGLLVTRTVDTGQGGENDPNRTLASLESMADAADPQSTLPLAQGQPTSPVRPWVGEVAPVRVRKLYFSEKLDDPNNPNSATQFYLTVDGQTPAQFDPASSDPNIVVRQGEVEDWIIENRSTELHAFHIHQIHFQLVEWSGRPISEPFLRDTVNVPYFNGRMLQYPSVRLRMDFRDPNTVGTFVYHCHLLEHEDGGMMGIIRVEPADSPNATQ